MSNGNLQLIVVVTKPVSIRPFKDSDMEMIKGWTERPELSEYFRRHPHTFTWQLAMFSAAFIVEKDGVVVGLLDLANSDSLSKKIDVGLLMLPEVEGKRAIYRTAFSCVADYCFKYLNFNKIGCRVLGHRTDLVSFLCTYGWQVEGVLPQNCWYQERFFDEIQICLLKTDWYAALTKHQLTKEEAS